MQIARGVPPDGARTGAGLDTCGARGVEQHLEDVAAVDAEGVLVRMMAALERQADQLAATDVLGAEIMNSGGLRADRVKEPGPIEDGLANGLKEEARTDGFEGFRLLKKSNVVAAFEKDGGEQTGHAASDDGDAAHYGMRLIQMGELHTNWPSVWRART